jgi:hypothetical protein
MTIRREIAEPRRETSARSPENPMIPVQYAEGPRGEPVGRRLVVAADRLLQQKRMNNAG